MLQSFLNYIKKEQLFNSGNTCLLAISGGIDSVVMIDLFAKAKFKFAVAHCNFQLRTQASNEDEEFVKQLAEQHKVVFHSKRFETKKYAEQEGVSIQMAARDLRYDWFKELRFENKYSFIATAHHQDDNLETILLNLTKGTSLKGLRGILPKNESIIRPLLSFEKKDIEAYAKKNNLIWREDASNQSTKYERNKIRLEVIPILKELNPKLLENLNQNTSYLRDTEAIYETGLSKNLQRVVEQKDDENYISIRKLQKINGYATVLYEFLKSKGFNSKQVQQIIESLNSESGKVFESKTHQLIKDRKFLIVAEKVNKNKTHHLIDIKQKSVELSNLKFDINLVENKNTFTAEAFKEFLPKNENEVKLQYSKLAFPLRLRHWQQGDFFYPFGMNKKKQKLSKYFKNQKFNLLEKDKIWILEDDKKRIVWVVGHRIDDRFAISRNTKKIYSIILSDV